MLYRVFYKRLLIILVINGLVLSSAETSTSNTFLHPTFTTCTVRTLSYLDDSGVTQDLEHALDRKITLGCDSPNTAYIPFNSNDNDTSDTLYDCKILLQGGTSGTPRSGTLTLYNKTTSFKGDIDASQNKVSCKTHTLNGNDLADSYYTKVQSDNNYYTKLESE